MSSDISSTEAVFKQDIARLLKDSEAISRDVGAYFQFRQNRQAVLEKFIELSESKN